MSEREDPRPWWFTEFRKDLFQRLNRRDAEVDRRFDEMSTAVRQVRDDSLVNRGTDSGRKAVWVAIGIMATTLVAIAGVVLPLVVR